MNALETEIRTRIEAEGPLSIAEYMTLCLTHPSEGYYTNRHPIGGRNDGDFITAPEVSQMFGELIGVWCMEVWRALGSPKPFNLVELGPGRGTLIRDLLRAGKAIPEFINAAKIHLMEISPTLQKQQAELLAEHINPPNWFSEIAHLPDGPSIIIANEFLDALPFHQWVKFNDNWHERAVGLENDKLSFTLRPNKLPHHELPPGHAAQKNGTVFETAPAREAQISTIAEKLKLQTGAALFIDYGHFRSDFGDTFQAIKSHKFTNPLHSPGKADLTNHVDFEPLMMSAKAAGCVLPPPATQGKFLLQLGLLERAGVLGSDQSKEAQVELHQAVERLAGNQQMGELFKTMAFSSHAINWPSLK